MWLMKKLYFVRHICEKKWTAKDLANLKEKVCVCPLGESKAGSQTSWLGTASRH